jgi:hypothetical protein
MLLVCEQLTKTHHPKIRKRKTKMETKAKSPRWHIDALKIIRALEDHVAGKKKLETSQVQAALTLLKKRLPDASLPRSPKKKREADGLSLDDLK